MKFHDFRDFCLAVGRPGTGLGEAPRGAARREGTRSAPRGLSSCIKSSHTTLLTTLERLEVSTIVLVPSENFWYDNVTALQDPPPQGTE